jgi:hypothetical protein
MEATIGGYMASTVALIAPTNDFMGSVNVTSTSNISDK